MISDKWRVTPETMEKTLDKIEHLAACYEFSTKELLQIRLLCEETLSVLTPALSLSAGRCWAETDSKGFSFIISCSASSQGINEETRKKLLDMDKGNRKGGVFGAIGKALETLFIPEYSPMMGAVFTESMGCHGMGGYYIWTAEQDFYTLTAQEGRKPNMSKQDDDGLEISIVEGYADDIKAKVKPGGSLEITVTKRYSEQPKFVEFVL